MKVAEVVLDGHSAIVFWLSEPVVLQCCTRGKAYIRVVLEEGSNERFCGVADAAPFAIRETVLSCCRATETFDVIPTKKRHSATKDDVKDHTTGEHVNGLAVRFSSDSLWCAISGR
jgi:hypothetical protein